MVVARTFHMGGEPQRRDLIMGLTTCPDCKREVSSHAAACPHCGYAMTPAPDAADAPVVRERVVREKRRVSFGNIVMGLLGLTFVILAVLWYFGVVRFV